MSLNFTEGDNIKLLELLKLLAIQMTGDGRSRGKGTESSPYGKEKQNSAPVPTQSPEIAPPSQQRRSQLSASSEALWQTGRGYGQDMSDLNAPVNCYCRCCNKDVKKIGFTPPARQRFLSERSLQEGKKKKSRIPSRGKCC